MLTYIKIIIAIEKSTYCLDIFERECISSGIFTIYPWGDLQSVDVFCDMETSDGGWTVSMNN